MFLLNLSQKCIFNKMIAFENVYKAGFKASNDSNRAHISRLIWDMKMESVTPFKDDMLSLLSNIKE